MQIYKIKNMITGEFSNGGSTPHFNKTGKMWKHKGHLANHLNQIENKRIYGDCKVVLYDLVETEVGVFSIDEHLSERQKRVIDADNKQKELKLEREVREKLLMYLELKKEFGDV